MAWEAREGLNTKGPVSDRYRPCPCSPIAGQALGNIWRRDMQPLPLNDVALDDGGGQDIACRCAFPHA